jgi:hypothetical protein
MKLEINIKGNTSCCFKETYQPSPASNLTKISQILSGGLTFGKDWETAVLKKKKRNVIPHSSRRMFSVFNILKRWENDRLGKKKEMLFFLFSFSFRF